MATAADIVGGALQTLGVKNQLNPNDPYLEEQFFNQLLRMISLWSSLGIDLGITTPTVPADELGNPDDTNDVLITTLGVRGAKIAKVSPSLDLKKDQKIYYRQMKALYITQPKQCMPSSAPYGQGNNYGPRSRRFFPEPTTGT